MSVFTWPGFPVRLGAVRGADAFVRIEGLGGVTGGGDFGDVHVGCLKNAGATNRIDDRLLF